LNEERWAREEAVTRYILVGLSVLLAISQFARGDPTGATVAGRIAGSLGYAFCPALLGFVLAGAMALARWARSLSTTFQGDWDLVWGIALGLLIILHAAALAMT
jgi:hypothetical protein